MTSIKTFCLSYVIVSVVLVVIIVEVEGRNVLVRVVSVLVRVIYIPIRRTSIKNRDMLKKILWDFHPSPSSLAQSEDLCVFVIPLNLCYINLQFHKRIYHMFLREKLVLGKLLLIILDRTPPHPFPPGCQYPISSKIFKTTLLVVLALFLLVSSFF